MIPTSHLNTLRAVATWGGVGIALAGVIYNLATSDDKIGAWITFSGISIGCIGNFIAAAVSRRDKIERRETLRRIDSLESELEETANRAFDAEEVIENPAVKAILKEAKENYWIAHQDDGR